jgi:hypothetical protein
MGAADITGVQDMIDARERVFRFRAQQIVRIGDHSDSDVTLRHGQPSAGVRHTVEKVYDAGFKRVFSANHQQSFLEYQLLNQFRAMAQVIG